MARLHSLLVAALLLLGCGDAPPPSTLCIATWNVHRLFDASCDSARCGAGAYEALPSPQELEGQLDRVASAIAALDVDVVLLQEVETAALLDALAARLAETHPHAAFGERGGAGSLDVGVLSRLPIAHVARHGDALLHRPDGSPTRFTREVLEVRLAVGGREVIAFVAHLKSKRDDDPGRRWAEARRLGELGRAAVSTHPGALVVVGGDLNDVPDSPPLRVLEEGGRLCRVAAPLRLDAATHHYEGVDEAIDHLYVARLDAAEPCPGRARVVGSPRDGFAGSDHAALGATFDLVGGHDGADLATDPG